MEETYSDVRFLISNSAHNSMMHDAIAARHPVECPVDDKWWFSNIREYWSKPRGQWRLQKYLRATQKRKGREGRCEERPGRWLYPGYPGHFG